MITPDTGFDIVPAQPADFGLGRRLLAHLAKVAVDRDCGRMEWSVLNWNETALRVYRAIGAQPLDEWTVQRLTGEGLARLAAQG